MDAEQALQEALEAVRAAHFGAGGVRDLGALCTSGEHAAVARAIAGLADIDFRRVRIAAQTAFWLNAFNALVVRDLAELAQAATVKEVEAFFEQPRVRVAGFGYSLDDIEHGLLRGNMPKFGAKKPPMQRGDPRLAHTPLAYDERMHFGLYSAGRSSPPLRVFDGGHVDRDLEEATAAYVQRRRASSRMARSSSCRGSSSGTATTSAASRRRSASRSRAWTTSQWIRSMRAAAR